MYSPNSLRSLVPILLLLPHLITPLSTTPVAIVTGASRGIGKGIAIELGALGYEVYCLGRSTRSSPFDDRDLTVEASAEEVTAAGGRGVPTVCDALSTSAQTSTINAIAESAGRLDCLVCSAYTVPTDQPLRSDFWLQGMPMWDAVHGVGLRSVFASCCAAAPHMIETSSKSGRAPVVALVSSFGGQSYTFNVPYGVGKAAVDRLAKDMAVQLKPHGVATTALYPGVVKTENNLRMLREGTWEEASGGMDLENGETPRFSGRGLAELLQLSKDEMLERSGSVEVIAELANEFDFYDVGGGRPSSIRSLRYLLPNFVFPSIEAKGGSVPSFVKEIIPDILLPWSVFSSGPQPE